MQPAGHTQFYTTLTDATGVIYALRIHYTPSMNEATL